MSLLLYLELKNVIRTKKNFHVPFVNPLSAGPVYLRECMWEVPHIDRWSYFSLPNKKLRHLTTFSASTLNLESIGGNFRPFRAILTDLWPLQGIK